MSFVEAFKGAKVELAGIRSPIQRALRAVSISRILVGELASLLTMAPYGIRAMRLHTNLPSGTTSKPMPTNKVTILRDIAYASQPRNVMDIYVPPGAAYGINRPVALFCHGGVWAAGEKWQYAPMATCLAQAGILVVVMHYTLYPNALVPQLALEVSAALSWTLDHIEDYGGDSSQVSLMGHSAGAHLCAMALMHRAMEAHRALHPGTQAAAAQPPADPRMPARALLVSGVYDIGKHYEYEKTRGVHGISTMERAVGGRGGFAACSPAVVLADALAREAGVNTSEDEALLLGDTSSFYNSFELAGEAIATRIGFERVQGGSHPRHRPAADLAEESRFAVAAAQHLPPVHLLSSCTDITVPWYESAEMYWLLRDCGVAAKHLVYNRVGHADFVIDWSEQMSQPEHILQDWPQLPPGSPDFARDIVKLLLGSADPVTPHRDAKAVKAAAVRHATTAASQVFGQ